MNTVVRRDEGTGQTRKSQSRFDGWIRSVFPSISYLTYNPVFKAIVNSVSWLYGRTSRLYRRLPPNHLRIRVGVGNDLFFNHPRYLTTSYGFWLEAFSKQWVTLNSNIVDIGCGCGRYAHILRDVSFYGERYVGTYTGIDIDDELLSWCRKNFPANFSFHRSGHTSTSYKPGGSGGEYRLPLEDGTQDFVFSRSLVSHLLEAETLNYFSEAFRVLRPGGVISMTYFSLDTRPPTYGTRHKFAHQIGMAYVESLAQPTAAVAYYDRDIKAMLAAAGFRDISVTSATGVWQQVITGRK